MEYKVAKYFQIEQDIIEAIKSGRLKPCTGSWNA